jgi:hypothetical protein
MFCMEHLEADWKKGERNIQARLLMRPGADATVDATRAIPSVGRAGVAAGILV